MLLQKFKHEIVENYANYSGEKKKGRNFVVVVVIINMILSGHHQLFKNLYEEFRHTARERESERNVSGKISRIFLNFQFIALR